MKTCMITIACVLVICLLLAALSYVEFGTANFIRIGMALTSVMGSDSVYQIAESPEPIWLSGTREAFCEKLESEGYLLRMDEQLGSRIPVEKDGLRDYIFWSANGMYHKWTWESCGEPARDRSDVPVSVYALKSAAGAAYFYPQADTAVTVGSGYAIDFAYPAGGLWTVTARPDGTLLGENGLEYDCLFWRGSAEKGFSMEEGFCVAGRDTAAFLEDTLAKLGLNRREAGALLRTWLPELEGSAYNLISFHTDPGGLEMDPMPDTCIRVVMVYRPLEEPVEIAPQELNAPVRSGFTVVEWVCGAAE